MSTDQAQPLGEDEVREVQVMDQTLATIMRADIDVQIATAKAYPRSLKKFMDDAMTMATFSVEIAEDCTYDLTRGNKSITGKSVRLAEIIFSNYGNCRVGARVVGNDGKHVTAQGVFHDLEKNVHVTIEVKRSILQHEWKNGHKTGRMILMNEDMQTMVGNGACSVAYRNATFKGIPVAIVNTIWDAAKKVARGTLATLVERRDKAVQYFHEMQITDERICTALGVQKIEDIGLDQLSRLSGMRSAIKNKEASLDEVFPLPDDDAKKKAEKATKATADKLNKTGNGIKDAVDKIRTDLKNSEGGAPQP